MDARTVPDSQQVEHVKLYGAIGAGAPVSGYYMARSFVDLPALMERSSIGPDILMSLADQRLVSGSPSVKPFLGSSLGL